MAVIMVIVGVVLTVVIRSSGFEPPRTYPGIRSVQIDADHGDVEVVGADITEVRVTRNPTGKAPTLESSGSFSLHLGYACNEFEICSTITDTADSHMDYALVVPRDIQLTVNSRKGDITLRGLTGLVKANTTQGTLTQDPAPGRSPTG